MYAIASDEQRKPIPDPSIHWRLTGRNMLRAVFQVELPLEGARSDFPFSDPSALRAHAYGFVGSRGDTLVSVPRNPDAQVRSKTVPGWSWWLSGDLSRLRFSE
jgi:hypothetical protein